MAFDVPWFAWKFSFPICFHTAFHCYPTSLFSFPQSSAFILLWHPLHPNLALWSNCLIIHRLMFLKHSILARIMRHFGSRLSFPQFVIPMTINIFTIPTNLPFCFRYHFPLPDPRSSWSTNSFCTLISIHPIVSHFLIMSTTLLVNPLPFRSLGASLHTGSYPSFVWVWGSHLSIGAVWYSNR
jgi:hypothetical protein